MNPNNSNLGMERNLPMSQKRQILWNIIDPGDPYDIKKSMIAKIPGDRQNFMGEHLEIICLFQAAEITRLGEYLMEYKIKYRQVNREQLDRHSYEVQIKELTQQLNDENSFRVENQKLKDFLKKQTSELEDLRKRQHYGQGVGQGAEKYQDALRQIEVMFQDNQKLKAQNSSFYSETQHLKARISALETAQKRQLDELRSALSNQTTANYERQKQEMSFKFENEINRLEYQVKRLKQINDTKNKQIDELMNRNKMIQLALDEESRKLAKVSTLEKNVHEYESRFGMLSTEIERLNQVLRKKAHECDDLKRKCRQFEEQLHYKGEESQQYANRNRMLETKIAELTTQLNDANHKMMQLSESQLTIRKYEDRIELLSREVERLNTVLKEKLHMNDMLQSKMAEMEYEMKKIDVIRRENEDLKRFVNENLELKRRLAEFESRVPLTAQENQRLGMSLRRKEEQVASWQIKYRNLQHELELLRSKSVGLQRQINQQYKSKISQYERQIQSMSRESEDLMRKLGDYGQQSRVINEYENKIAMLSQEIQRLNQVLRGKTNQTQEVKRKLYEANDMIQRKQTQLENMKNQMNNLQYRTTQQYKSRITSFETRIKKSNDDNDELRKKLMELTTASYKITEYESKIAFSNQEIERLNQSIRQKVNEIQSMEGKIRVLQSQNENYRRSSNEYEYKLTSMQQDYESKRNSFEVRIRQFAEENEELSRRLRELADSNRKMSEYENRIQMLSNEIERLNSVLKAKLDDCNGLENKNRLLMQENEGLQREIRAVEQRISMEYQSKISSYEGKVRESTFENEDLRRKVEAMNDTGRKVVEYENKVRSMTQQIDRLDGLVRAKATEFGSVESRARLLEQQNDDLRRRVQQSADVQRRVSEYENRIAMLTQEMERLNSIIRTKTEQMNELENRLRIQQQEADGLRRSQSDVEFSMAQEHKTSVATYESRIATYETRFKQLTSECDDLKRRVQQLTDSNRRMIEYEAKITQLGQEIDRLNGVLRGKVSQVDELENRLRAEQQEKEDLRRRAGDSFEFKRQIESYETRISDMSIEIERLNGRLKGQVNDITALENRLRDSQHENDHLKRSVSDIDSRSASYEQHIQQMNQQNLALQRKLLKDTETKSILNEYQQRLANSSREIDRLNSFLASKDQELMNLSMQVKRNEQECEILRRSKGDWDYQLNSMNQELSSSKAQAENVRRENDELNQRLRQLRDTNQRINEYENRIQMLSNEIERLNSVLKAKLDDCNGLENKNRLLMQENEGLQREIRAVEQRISMEYQSKISSYEGKVRESTFENEDLRRKVEAMNDTGRKVVEYENKVRSMTQQIDRLDGLVRAKATEFGSVESRARLLEQQNDDLRRRVQQSADIQRRVSEYENRIAMLTQEMERLNSIIRTKTEQMNQLENRLRIQQQEADGLRRSQSDVEFSMAQEHKTSVATYESRIATYETRFKQLTSECDDLKRRVQQLTDSNRRMIEYEAKITQLGQEIDRLNGVLRGKVGQVDELENRLRIEQQEKEDLRRRAGDSFEFKRQIESYETRISDMSIKIERLNGRLKGQVNDITALENRLRDSQHENSRLQHLIGDAEHKLSQSQSSSHSQLNTYQLQIQSLNNENTQLRHRLQQQKDSHRIISEYQNRISLLSQDIQRYKANLNSKVQQTHNLQQTIYSLQIDNDRLKHSTGDSQYKITQKFQMNISNLQMEIRRLSDENSQLRRGLQQHGDVSTKIGEYDNNMSKMMQQIERLNTKLTVKVEELRSLQYKNDSLQQQYDRLSKQHRELQFQTNQQLQHKLSSYQSQLRHVNNENDDLKRKLTQLTASSNRFAEYENKILIMSQEIQRLNQILHVKKNQLDDYHLKDRKYLAEIQRLNNALRLKVEESEHSEATRGELLARIKMLEGQGSHDYNVSNNYKIMSSEFETSKKHLAEYEQSFKKLHAEFERLQTILQQLKKQNYNLKIELREYDGLADKNRVLSAEIDRLTQIIESHKQEIGQLRLRYTDEAALHKRINEHMALMVVLFSEIQSLRQRVKDKQREVEDVRRSSLMPYKI